MAFDPANLALSVDTIGGGSLRIHFYEAGADTKADIVAAGYVTRAVRRGLRVGDLLVVRAESDTFLAELTGVEASGHGTLTISTAEVPPLDYASKSEAEAGAQNTRVMTPLRTKQAIDEQVPPLIAGAVSGVGSFNGRTGVVVPVENDYAASEIGNDSAVSGASVADALDVLGTAVSARAPIASPTFTGTVGGVTKAMVGLGNADNTSDANKPVSTAQQAALDGKATVAQAKEETLILAIGDESTDLTPGVGKVTFRMPYALTLYAGSDGVRGSLVTAGTTISTFDINDGGVSILSTKLTIDANEKTSLTAATPVVISDTTLADDAEITIDIDGAGTDAAGAKIMLKGTRA